MKHAMIVMMAAAVSVAGALSWTALADGREDGDRMLRTRLRGIEESPAVSSTGSGTFRAKVAKDRSSIDYELEYEDLEGDVLQSHIHLGQSSVNGGVAAFLCTNMRNSPAGTPTCPGPRAGSVSGTITADDVVGPAGQGLAPGEFAELLRAIDRSVTYVNVHTTKHPGGEIRGQIGGDD